MIPRALQKLVFVLGLSASAAVMAAPGFPARPVSLMVPYPAGGASDITARAAQGPIGASLGVPAVVENLGGANGMVAANKVLAAPADGYYVFQGSPNELILAGLTNKAARYKPSDFEMVQPVAISPYVVLVRPGLPVKNVDELMELARTSPVPLSYGTGGMGSQHHLVVVDFARRAKAELNHIPYKGGAPMLTDLVGGQLDFTIFPMQSNYVDFQREGKLRILATLEPKRLAVLPDVPSVEESRNLKGFHYAVWTAYLVKKGTPLEVREKIREAVVKSLDDANMRKVMDAQGKLMFKPLSLQEADAFYQREIRTINELVQASGFQPE